MTVTEPPTVTPQDSAIQHVDITSEKEGTKFPDEIGNCQEQQTISVPRSAVLSRTSLKSTGSTPPALACGSLSPLGDLFRFVLIGGIAEGGFPPVAVTCYILDIRTMLWTCIGNDVDEMSIEHEVLSRFGHSATLIDDPKTGCFTYIFGGFTKVKNKEVAGTPAFATDFAAICTNPCKNLYEMHAKGDNVTFEAAQAEGPEARGYHASCALEFAGSDSLVSQILFLHGGATSHQALPNEILNDAWIFNNGKWHPVKQTGIDPGARCGHKLIYWKAEEAVLMFGGDHQKGPIPSKPLLGKLTSSDGEYYVTWKLYNVRGSPPMARSFHSMELLSDDRLIIWGGLTSALVSDVLLLQRNEQDQITWLKPVYENNVTTRACASSVMSGKFIGYGGCDNTGCFSNSSSIAKSELFLGTSLELKSKITKSAKSKKGFTFKLITVGESGVGKTCLIRRFVDDIYNETHMATISTDLQVLRTMVRGKLATIQLWDTAGQERYAHLTSSYARDAEGFLIVYDATRRETFERVKFWLDWLFDNRQGDEIPGDTLLIGNKNDLADEVVVTEDEGRRYAKRLGIDFIATSAKSAMNVDIALMSIVRHLVDARENQLTSGNLDRPQGITMSNVISLNQERSFSFNSLCNFSI